VIKKLKSVIFFSLFFNLISPCFAGNDILKDLEGEWISKKYLEHITKNRSPQKAINEHNYPAVFIKEQGSFLQVMLIINFHEGVRYEIKRVEILSKGIAYKIYLSEVDGMPGYSYSMIIEKKKNNNSLKVSVHPDTDRGSYEITQEEYVKANPSVENVINRRVLEGRYTDERGRLFLFNKDLTAVWPGKKFKYTICIDIMSDVDCFYEVDEKGRGLNRFLFEWKINSLVIKRDVDGHKLFRLRKE
jgi:hypothetical protein